MRAHALKPLSLLRARNCCRCKSIAREFSFNLIQTDTDGSSNCGSTRGAGLVLKYSEKVPNVPASLHDSDGGALVERGCVGKASRAFSQSGYTLFPRRKFPCFATNATKRPYV